MILFNSSFSLGKYFWNGGDSGRTDKVTVLQSALAKMNERKEIHIMHYTGTIWRPPYVWRYRI